MRSVRVLLVLFLALAVASPPALGSGLDRALRAAIDEETAHRDPAAGGDDGGAPGREDHSKRKAFLLSLLLPGLGQRYNEDTLRSRAFFAAEAAVWTAFIVYKLQENWRTDDFEEYARAYAGVPAGEKDTEYYRILTIYDNSDDYNMAVRIEARQIYPTDPAAQDAYYAANAYGDDREFRWRTNSNRLDYRVIRNDAIDSGKRADYALTAALINRAISAVEASRGAGRWSPVRRAASHIRLDTTPEGDPTGLRVGWTTRF
ncbi:MAG: hypothetical protein JW958_08280 [Candidatus Eisenbacteria bacterium]|nr:hypothetical protein [Candidatus Eisenbacteria bacterium]